MARTAWAAQAALFLFLLFLLTGCACGSTDSDDSNPPIEEAERECESSGDCRTGDSCEGNPVCVETDEGGSECVPQSLCRVGQTCDESQDKCVTDCAVTLDADGDGQIAKECGGDDCDDSRVNVYLGNQEVCDDEHVDEDCDPETFGGRDEDEDDVVSTRCCNESEDGELVCGTDCDERSASVKPGGTEVCNGVDDNCDGEIDEGVFEPHYVDADEDGYGNPRSSAEELSCESHEGFSRFPTDCNDESAEVYPGALEVCDGVDTNCDGAGVEDLDGDGHIDENAQCIETDDSLPIDDCDDSDGARYGGREELCNGVDDNCDEIVDEDEPTNEDCRSRDNVATSFCGDGVCNIQTCDDGYLNCDDSDDACETDGFTDRKNCGGCGYQCLPGAECIDGLCEEVLVVDLQRGPTGGCVLLSTGNVSCWGENEYTETRTADSLVRNADDTGPLSNVVAVDVGLVHSCAIVAGDTEAENELYCWGARHLGDGTYREDGDGTRLPVQVKIGDADGEPLLGVVEISVYRASCARTFENELYCWGPEDTGNWPVPIYSGGAMDAARLAEIPGNPEIIGIAKGIPRCAIQADGRARCWGYDGSAQRGDGGGQTAPGQTPTLLDVTTPIREIAMVQNPRNLETGLLGGCASSEGKVYCWGTGGVGNGAAFGVQHFSPVELTGGFDGVKSLSSYVGGRCLIDNQDQIYCWGRPSWSRGGGMAESGAAVLVPTPIFPDLKVKQVEQGCALSVSGVPYCWGAGETFLGQSDGIDRFEPTSLEGLGQVASVVVDAAGCARMVDGRMTCWGRDANGQLGRAQNIAPAPAPGPDFIEGLRTATEIANHHRAFCAAGVNGELYCWGRGTHKNGGYSVTFAGGTLHPSPELIPLNLSPVPLVRDVSVACHHSCIRTQAGTVYCSGDGTRGQLGTGVAESFESFERPVLVEKGARAADDVLLDGVVKMDIGSTAYTSNANCGRDAQVALRDDGTVWVWGPNLLGLLGGAVSNDQDAFLATQVPGLEEIVDVAVAERSICALRADRQLFCWGAYERASNLSPAGVQLDVPEAHYELPASARFIKVGGQRLCARSADNRVWCWGDNELGPFDSSYGVRIQSPTELRPGLSLRNASVYHHACGIDQDDRILCFGDNRDGRAIPGGPATIEEPTPLYF